MGIVIIACGIIIYFIFREWAGLRVNKLQLERLTAEQITQLRRIEAEAGAEVRKRSLGDFRYLRLAMLLAGGAVGCIIGLILYKNNLLQDESMIGAKSRFWSQIESFYGTLTVVLTVLGAALGIFVEFVTELWWRRKVIRTENADN